MKAVVSIIGRDMVGVIAKATTICAEKNVNVVNISQTVMDSLFTMTMLVEVDKCTVPFDQFAEQLKTTIEAFNLRVYVMHEDIFNSMHKV